MKTTLQVRAPVRYELMLNCSMQAVNIRKNTCKKKHTHTHTDMNMGFIRTKRLEINKSNDINLNYGLDFSQSSKNMH